MHADLNHVAGLEADKVLEIPWMTKYGNTNLTEAAVVWEDISFDAGMVALDHTWAESKGIPRAQDFPWDKSKGLFVLNGYHSLHCLVRMLHLHYSVFMENFKTLKGASADIVEPEKHPSSNPRVRGWRETVTAFASHYTLH